MILSGPSMILMLRGMEVSSNWHIKKTQYKTSLLSITQPKSLI